MIAIMSFVAAANVPGSVPALAGNPMFQMKENEMNRYIYTAHSFSFLLRYQIIVLNTQTHTHNQKK